MTLFLAGAAIGSAISFLAALGLLFTIWGQLNRIENGLRALAAQEEKDMSQLSDAIQSASESADAAIGRVQEDVAALEQKIADLEAQIAGGTATQADLDNLAALKAKLDALDPTKPATLPPG